MIDGAALTRSTIERGDFALLPRLHAIQAHGDGIVPDGVASVKITPPEGRSIRVRVHRNLFVAPMPFSVRGGTNVFTVRWFNADGRSLRTCRVVLRFATLRLIRPVVKPTKPIIVHPAPGTEYP